MHFDLTDSLAGQAQGAADLLAQSGLGPDVERIQADPHPGPGGDQQRVVDATVFFCSDMTRSVSGQVLAVNAGEPAG